RRPYGGLATRDGHATHGDGQTEITGHWSLCMVLRPHLGFALFPYTTTSARMPCRRACHTEAQTLRMVAWASRPSRCAVTITDRSGSSGCSIRTFLAYLSAGGRIESELACLGIPLGASTGVRVAWKAGRFGVAE